MTRLEFEAALAPALACLGALWQLMPEAEVIDGLDGFMVRLTQNEALALKLSLETAIQAIATVQELIVRDREARR